MIPVLYKESATDFSSFGIGTLADCISCEVTEERNGGFECKLKYPTSGALFSELKKERIVKAKPNDTSAAQAFRIYRITIPLNGVVTVYAQHISYDLAHVGVKPFELSEVPPQVAIETVLQNTVLPHNFTFQTDYSSSKPFKVEKPKSVRACLGGTEGSLMNLWGGEFEWDNFRIIHHQGRGRNNGVVIEYAKNLTSLEHDADISDVYSDLLPYAVIKNEDGSDGEVVTLPEVTLPITTSLNVRKSVVRDFTESFEYGTAITVAMLREKAIAYLENNPLGIETPTITVSFEPLWKQPEYAAILERVSLCDTVTVKHTKLGISVKTKVIKTTFDTIAEKYTQITLGSCKSNLTDTIRNLADEVQSQQKEVERFPAMMKSAIEKATKQITGQTGGYVVLMGGESGEPYEFLVMDAPTIEEAVNVWRWNMGGLGFSSSGYNGEYATAITADGSIVANFITSGTLAANIIKAGVLSSLDGSSYWNLETGEVVLKSYASAESLERVEATASNAQSAASQAQSAADKAQGAADKAQSAAEGAQSTADKAQKDANRAQQDATLAQNAVEDLAADLDDLEHDVGEISGNVSSLASSVKTITTKQASLETSVEGLFSTVSSTTTRVEYLESDVGTLEGQVASTITDLASLKQTASEIAAEVSSKVDDAYGSSSSSFGWRLKSTGFYVYSNGSTVLSITSSGLSVVGAIDATSGSIGNLTIDGYLYFGGNTSYYISANYNDGNYYINLPGLKIDKASQAVFSGKLSAPSGTIGGFTITTSAIYKTKTSYNSSTSGVYIGTDGIGLGAGAFYVTAAGKLYATNAEIYGYIYCEGLEEVRFYGTHQACTYKTEIGGTGIFSSITMEEDTGTTHYSYSEIRPFGSIVTPANKSYANDGMIFGIMSGSSWRTDHILTGMAVYYNLVPGYGASDMLFRVHDKTWLEAWYTSDNGWGWIIDLGNPSMYGVLWGTWYIDESASYIGYITVSSTRYGALYGNWRVGDKLYFGSSTLGYITTVSVSSSTYPYLSGTWYCGTLRFGTSTTSYNLRIDQDQVTFYYGSTEVGDIEAYSTYVDIQGTFKTNGKNWISSSDARVKNSIQDFSEAYSVLFDKLKPRLYKYNAGNSNRLHTGFVVQETLEAMDEAQISTQDFAAVCAFGDPNDEETEWGIRYDEIIPLNTWEIQKLKARVSELETKIKSMEEAK